jgi:hypothetical protein
MRSKHGKRVQSARLGVVSHRDGYVSNPVSGTLNEPWRRSGATRGIVRPLQPPPLLGLQRDLSISDEAVCTPRKSPHKTHRIYQDSRRDALAVLDVVVPPCDAMLTTPQFATAAPHSATVRLRNTHVEVRRSAVHLGRTSAEHERPSTCETLQTW